MRTGVSKRRIDHLDGLRAVAAFAVVLQHALELSYFYRADGGWLGALLQEGFSLGRYGVAVFFLISGYLIPSSMAPNPRALGDFALGRFFRLYPLYWTSLIGAVLLYPLLGGQTFPAAVIAANVTMLQPLLGAEHVIGLYWTLFVELIFYGLCALLVVAGLLHRARTPLVLVAIMGVVMIVTSLWSLAGITPRLDGVLRQLGTFAMYVQLMLLGQALRAAPDADDPRLARVSLAITLGALAIYCGTRQITGIYAIGLTPLGVFAATGAAISTFLLSRRVALLRHPVIGYLGRISYGIYLFHAIALVVAIRVLPSADDNPTTIALVLFVAGASIGAAALAHRLIELPAIARGRRMRRRSTSIDRTFSASRP